MPRRTTSAATDAGIAASVVAIARTASWTAAGNLGANLAGRDRGTPPDRSDAPPAQSRPEELTGPGKSAADGPHRPAQRRSGLEMGAALEVAKANRFAILGR